MEGSMTDGILRAYANTPYGQIHYRHAGAGQPLLLLHQTASCSGQFEGMIPTLASSHRALALDTPGYGMSDPPPHQYTVAEYAGSIVAFLDVMGIDRANIFGHHTGAALACEVAAGYPDRVDKLVVYGVPYWDEPSEMLESRIRYFPLKDDGSHLMEMWDDITGRMREGLFPKPYSEEALEAIQREVVWKLMAGERRNEAYIAIYRHSNGILERLPLIQAPTLVMSGDQDGQRPAMEPVAARIRRNRTRLLKGGSYFTAYDDPEALSREILDFLANPGV
jgi:pimeloyl-ACP methyl ester carboxylesterase